MPCAALDFNILSRLFHLLIALALRQKSLRKSTFLTYSLTKRPVLQPYTLLLGPRRPWPCPEVGAISWAQPEKWAEQREWGASWERAACGVNVLRHTSPELRQAGFTTEWPAQVSPWVVQVIRSSLCYRKLTFLWVWRKFCHLFPNIRNPLYIRY